MTPEQEEAAYAASLAGQMEAFRAAVLDVARAVAQAARDLVPYFQAVASGREVPCGEDHDTLRVRCFLPCPACGACK